MKKYHPCALNIKDKNCLVVGHDWEAIDKAVKFLRSGAKVTVLDSDLNEDSEKKLKSAGAKIEKREFHLDDIRDQFMVILARRDNPDLTEQVAAKCRKKKILLMAIDQPDYCDVVNMSLYDRGLLRVAISTGGAAPAVARKIRLGLDQSLKNEPLEKFLDELARKREELYRDVSDPVERREKLIELSEGFQFSADIKFPDWFEAVSEKRVEPALKG